MNRHYARSIALQSIYESDFRKSGNPEEIFKRHLKNIGKNLDTENAEFALELIRKVGSTGDVIDEQIKNSAPDWPLNQIAVIDRNILRLSICELNYFDTPPKVVINEAVELAKTFGSEKTSKFINGVLGTIYRQSNKYKVENEKKEN